MNRPDLSSMLTNVQPCIITRGVPFSMDKEILVGTHHQTFFFFVSSRDLHAQLKTFVTDKAREAFLSTHI